MNATTTETIRKEIFVDASPETAFRVFTEQIATWWPLHKYGIYLEERDRVDFEDRDGWRLVERAKDGRETIWGEVLDYEFASRLRMTWHPGRSAEEMPTEIELTFKSDDSLDGYSGHLIASGDGAAAERDLSIDVKNTFPITVNWIVLLSLLLAALVVGAHHRADLLADGADADVGLPADLSG